MGGGGSAPQLNTGQIQQQQAGQNIATATAQQLLNQTNQTGPQGSLKYNQIGSTDVGGTNVPQFEAVQTLSPEQQKIYDATTGLQNQALGFAPKLLNNVEGAISQPLDFSKLAALPANGQEARDTAYNALMSRNRTELDRTRSADATLAANQGIAPGSEAWNRQTQHNDQALVDASNQATINASALAGQDLSQAQAIRNQGLNEMLTQRTQPISDLTALLGVGGSYQQPSYVNTPQANVPATDVTSPALANFQAQLQQQQRQQSASNALTGGLFGLGGSVLGGLAGGPLGASLGGGLFGLAGRGAGSGSLY